MITTISPATRLTATQASRSFASVLARAQSGETFVIEKGGIPMACVTPPQSARNGAALRALLQAWEPDEQGFSAEVLEAMATLREPRPRDQERLAWVAD
ncbi:MAG: hypothetical protein LBV06_11075 [Propionibacteriaceae bacterium]|nr:hypothetical protein [Propionibacteriaceae bacterium]